MKGWNLPSRRAVSRRGLTRRTLPTAARAARGPQRFLLSLLLCCLAAAAPVGVAWVAYSQTAQGEIEGRPSPTFRRRCLGGANAGKTCKQNSECPASSCPDRNVFNITIAVLYDAPAADITSIQNMVTAASATIFDVTDGQAQIGHATIHNNAVNSDQADVEIHPATNPVWWVAQTGNFRTGGVISVSIDNINDAIADGDAGPSLAHEFLHLVFDPRDEYERRLNCGANTVSGEDCPVPAANNGTCLMDGNGSELCWGQGNSANTADVSGGNHDPTNITEQSACRSNRSCWDQVVWSWPSTFLKPAAAPDPAANGATVNPTNFIVTSNDVRVVLVLDESGSMGAESPTRMERLKVAAGDFIATAENNTQLGLRSFATDAETSSGRQNVAVAALGGNRSNWTNAVTALTPSTRTNIGAGLQKAKDMIVAAGGVTANTYVVLFTDGLNNEPGTPANAAADLQAKVADLMASGIPVFVTCTGGDLGLQSQCAEIASGTGGFFSDSADASRLPQNFVDFHESITGHQGISSVETTLSKMTQSSPPSFFVDEGSESASFSLLWKDSGANARGLMVDPNGKQYPMQPIPQGAYVRVPKPVSGQWQMRIDAGGADSPATARGYVLNRINRLVVSTRWPTRRPGEEMYVYAFPKSKGGNITQPGAKLVARVTRPDGSTDTLELRDEGRDAPNHGDDVAGDGVFTGVYKNTNLKGAYGFQISGQFEQWGISHDAHEGDKNVRSPLFLRETRVSAAVGEPGDVPKQPEDDIKTSPWPPWRDYCCWLLLIALILLLIALILLWRCHRSKRVGRVVAT